MAGGAEQMDLLLVERIVVVAVASPPSLLVAPIALDCFFTSLLNMITYKSIVIMIGGGGLPPYITRDSTTNPLLLLLHSYGMNW